MQHKKLYGTVTVGTKGQIVIPVEAREGLDIKSGDKLYVFGAPGIKAVGLFKEEQLEAMINKMTTGLEDLRNLKEELKKDK